MNVINKKDIRHNTVIIYGEIDMLNGINMENKEFENVKCTVPTCQQNADVFVIVRLTDYLDKTAVCRFHLLAFIEGWLPSIKNKHKREGINNLAFLSSPRARVSEPR